MPTPIFREINKPYISNQEEHTSGLAHITTDTPGFSDLPYGPAFRTWTSGLIRSVGSRCAGEVSNP